MNSMDPAAETRQPTTIEFPITHGRVALIDADDFDLVSTQVWRYTSAGYAIANVPQDDGKRKTLAMQRFIMNPPGDRTVDHINRNKLDNRRCNLRIATRTDNNRNQPAQKRNQSGYKGVYPMPNVKHLPWYVAMKIGERMIRFGRFEKPEDAAMCYDKLARAIHGEFAVLNFPEAAW